MIYQSSRVFKLWIYIASHSQLLIRSPRDNDELTNHDVVFLSVTHICLPQYLYGVEIYCAPETKASELDALAPYREWEEDRRWFVISSEKKEYFVKAHSVHTSINTLNADQYPF